MNESKKNTGAELNDQEMGNAAGGRVKTPREKTVSCFHCGTKFQANEGVKGFVKCPNCGGLVDPHRTYR